MPESYHWLKSPSSVPATFSFTFFVDPPREFVFNRSPPQPREGPYKRRRPLWDVDGSSHSPKKKRRLRLALVTSRLSLPYSVPATNIADRGGRVARVGGTWLIPRHTEKNELRKGAIMNRVRQRLLALKAAQAKPPRLLRLPPLQLPHPYPQKKTHSQLVSAFALRDVVAPMAIANDVTSPLPQSLSSLSNYDALDLEDDALHGMDGEDTDAEMGGCAVGYYSDFSVPRSPQAGTDEYDYLDEVDGIPLLSPEGDPPPVPKLPLITPADEIAGLMEQDQGIDAYIATAVQAAGTYVMA